MYALEENGGWSGVHTESGVWTTLFGLLMWPVLFAPVPDVFRTRFQCTVDILSRFFQFSLIVNGCVCVCVCCVAAPLDLGSDAFYANRRELIEQRLGRIRQGDLAPLFDEVWCHEGTPSASFRSGWRALSSN
jgi:fanconi-associated nuclease 1